jgi:hypothetical protein
LGVYESKVQDDTRTGGLDLVGLSLSNKQTDNFPTSYGGLSGSGLWRVGARGDDGLIRWSPDDPIYLEGVVYFHDPTVEPEVIRCHGRRSIYDYLLTKDGLRPPAASE